VLIAVDVGDQIQVVPIFDLTLALTGGQQSIQALYVADADVAPSGGVAVDVALSDDKGLKGNDSQPYHYPEVRQTQ